MSERPVSTAPYAHDDQAAPSRAPVDGHRRRSRLLTVLVIASALLLIASWRGRKTLVDPDGVLPELLQEPIQTETEREPFAFSYAGKRYTVEPLADYELWGLVVSHNDIESMMDFVHDENSVDTKDLCVLWGENLETDDFHRVEFTSGDYTCFYQFQNGVTFHHSSLSNNHLITDSDAVRDVIADVNVGDQVHIVGSLVRYQEAGTRFWRTSSTTRRDTGDNACEVIYVDEIEILQAGAPVWHALYPLAWVLLVLAVIARIALFVWGIMKEAPT